MSGPFRSSAFYRQSVCAWPVKPYVGYVLDTQSVGLPARQENIHTFLGSRLLSISSRNPSTSRKIVKIGLIAVYVTISFSKFLEKTFNRFIQPSRNKDRPIDERGYFYGSMILLFLLFVQIGSNYCFLFFLVKFSGGGFVNRLSELFDVLDEYLAAITFSAFDNGLNVAQAVDDKVYFRALHRSHLQ